MRATLLVERNSSASAPVEAAVETRAAGEAAVTGQEQDEARKWEALIDHPLIDWVLDPSQLDEPGTVTPSKETIRRAINLARILSARGACAPTRVVPDAYGAIVFERKARDLFQSLRVSPDGTVEQCVFRDRRLVHRERL